MAKALETMGGSVILHTQSSPCIEKSQHVVAMFHVDDGAQKGCPVSHTIWSGGRLVAIELQIGHTVALMSAKIANFLACANSY